MDWSWAWQEGDPELLVGIWGWGLSEAQSRSSGAFPVLPRCELTQFPHFLTRTGPVAQWSAGNTLGGICWNTQLVLTIKHSHPSRHTHTWLHHATCCTAMVTTPQEGDTRSWPYPWQLWGSWIITVRIAHTCHTTTHPEQGTGRLTHTTSPWYIKPFYGQTHPRSPTRSQPKLQCVTKHLSNKYYVPQT